MEDLNVVDSINGAGTWLVRNQELLLSYAVNIVAAIAIIIIGDDRGAYCFQYR
ncbi:small-conductance mechanosensitive channel [Citrobacter koseri]|uniref:Small-conductance mechanosensitive channel n=1 Tax=Citrobacter koseri TaxID=545 RepID=A0A2X2W911_CITKO|nr:small-conductance mechanosensitive channel [Citrobacter koseri]